MSDCVRRSSQSEGGSDTHQLHFTKMAGFAGSTYLRAALVPRMLRSAISAFTRVFDAL
jgi:hypothetical protein